MKKPKPLVTIRQDGIEARVYRPEFRSFESVKYLNVAALRKAPEATIEVGTIEGPGVSWTLTAEIRDGKIVGFTTSSCEGCKQKTGIKATQRRKIIRAAIGQLEGYELEPIPVPDNLRRLPGWIVVMGPVVIMSPDFPGNPQPGCVYIWTPEEACWDCGEGSVTCVSPPDDPPVIST